MASKPINYDSNYEYSPEQTGFNPADPLAFVTVEGMEIIALKSVLEESEDRIFRGISLGRWAMEDPDPSVTNYSSLSLFNPDYVNSNEDNAVLFASSVNGILFTSQISPDVYSFTSWSKDDVELFSYINENILPKKRIQENINAEIDQVHQRLSRYLFRLFKPLDIRV